jgi:hypothetical protein
MDMRIKRKRQYVYLINYKFINGIGDGRCTLTRDKPIKNIEHLETAELSISKVNGKSKIFIMSYQLMSVK